MKKHSEDQIHSWLGHIKSKPQQFIKVTLYDKDNNPIVKKSKE